MSAQAKSDPIASTASAKNKKKKNKKKAGATTVAENKQNNVNGSAEIHALDDEDPAEDDPESPEDATDNVASPITADSNPTPSTQATPIPNGHHDTEHRLDALAQERDELLAEVSKLRKSLEDISSKHEEEMTSLQEQLEETEASRDNAESQYTTLLEKVNHIKSQLGERLKADAEELSQTRSQIEDLEEQNRNATQLADSLKSEVSKLRSENEKQSHEISNLRGRANLSQQNWVKERDELISREAYAREEFENARQAMQDWEVLAMEERTLRENLSERVTELEDQLSTQKEAYERVVAERDTQSTTVDGLQRALQDIQDARKRELREMVEQSQSQLDELRKRVQDAEEAVISSKAALEASQKELDRALPFEKEVKEKNLLIGKLRHQAVILNDHLTKALRFLKQRKPEDMVDRQLVTNHFLQFLALDRSDPKKFQILQLIAALLGWSDEDREQAGLARPGTAGTNLRVPMSPFRRTPSTPSLTSDHMLADGGASKETLAELWSDFLEREASDGTSDSRRPSTASPSVEKQPGGLGIS